MRYLLFISLLLSHISGSSAQTLQAVQIYTDEVLLGLIKENKHLGQVVVDKCQLVQDIEVRAVKSKIPSYQFLWGDMLAYGVCVKKDVTLGLHYMAEAGTQGLPEALEQIGRYHHLGKFMQSDIEKAIISNTENSENHTTLLAAMKATDLDKVLSYDGPFTVFAPSDIAFEALFSNTSFASAN